MRSFVRGQALIEYIFLVAFITALSLKLAGNFTDFMRTSVGNLGHILSQNITVGVCESDCFFGGYRNGYQP